MKQFLDQLFTTGQVTVPAAGVPFDHTKEIDLEIRQFDRAARLGIAGDAPELEMAVAKWAAELLAEAARLALARDLGEEAISHLLSRQCPKARCPETDYSADLFLHYLPNLIGWMERLAADDPLIGRLRELAGEWPLSSVGIREATVGSIEPFIGHPSLRQLYVDRILATGDLSRLSDARVAESVRAALGAHPELSRNVAKAVGAVAVATD